MALHKSQLVLVISVESVFTFRYLYFFFTLQHYCTKDHLISKGRFGILEFFQKNEQTNSFLVLFGNFSGKRKSSAAQLYALCTYLCKGLKNHFDHLYCNLDYLGESGYIVKADSRG